jgi:guanine deaminase
MNPDSKTCRRPADNRSISPGGNARWEKPYPEGSKPFARQFMHEATRLAIESVEKGWGGPFGAVIVKDGKVIGRGQNRVLLTGIPVYHAEVTAIIDASLRLNSKALLGSDSYDGVLEMIPQPEGSPDPVPERAKMLEGCELYVNGAPCPMCRRGRRLPPPRLP